MPPAPGIDKTAPKPGWWARARNLVIAQLQQGATPHRLALSMSLAATLSLFPVLGTTTILCIAVGAALKLNHPLMQLVNYLLAGVQLLLLVPFWKAGEWLGAPHLSLSVDELQQRFSENFWHSLGEFGWIALGGIAAWAIAAPFFAALLYVLLRPMLTRMAQKRRAA